MHRRDILLKDEIPDAVYRENLCIYNGRAVIIVCIFKTALQVSIYLQKNCFLFRAIYYIYKQGL